MLLTLSAVEVLVALLSRLDCMVGAEVFMSRAARTLLDISYLSC